MRFDILTLFPEAFESFLSTSLIGKAIEKEKIEVNIFNIRDFSKNKHKKVDNVPYGGGAGMLMTCQPLFDSIQHVKNLKEEIKLHKKIAQNTLKKDKRVNLRMSSKDLEAIKTYAVEEGLPYQTLISSVLHKFITGRLVDKQLR